MPATTLFRLALLVLAGLAGLPALAASADPIESPSRPAPPRCNDARVLADIRRAYAQTADALELKPLARIHLPRQTGLTAHPLADKGGVTNGPAWGSSRFCTAALDLEGGARDTVYYRIEAQVGAPQDQFEFTPCFAAQVRNFREEEGEPITCREYQRP